MKRSQSKGLPYRIQELPASGDTPVVKCPWCGEICDLEDAELDDYFAEVDRESGLYVHKDCGKLVMFLGADDWGN